MIAKKKHNPTERELEILQVLFTLGPSTVRQVHETLTEVRRVGYTSVLKVLQVMHEKGLVRRDESRHAHLYEAAVERSQLEESLARDFVDRVFGGSAMGLVARVLSSRGASEAEINSIRALLKEVDPDAGD